MGEDSNHSVMSDSQDAVDFTNKIQKLSSQQQNGGPPGKENTERRS